MGRRLALLVATDTYEDPSLTQLVAPASDAAELAGILGDEMLGGFEVEVLHNAASWKICERLDIFLSNRAIDDVVLLHFACHGVKHGDRGDLYLASKNTKHLLYPSTAVYSGFVNGLMNDSLAGVVILMLDCCYGGAFASGARAAGDDTVDVAAVFGRQEQSDGRGRVVISASSATEFAFEGEKLLDHTTGTTSVFTNALIEGIRSGEADRDRDGMISVGELYDYVFARVREHRSQQTPQMSTSEVRGSLYVAHSPRRRSVPVQVPVETLRLLEGDVPARLVAVQHLRDLTEGDDVNMAAAARETLLTLKKPPDDSFRVRQAVDEGLHRTELRLSVTSVDLGVLPACNSRTGVPAQVQLLGPPLVRLSSVTAGPPIRVRIEDDRIQVKASTATPGPIDAVVSVAGPAGTAELRVMGWVAPAPRTLVHQAEATARTIKAPSERAVVLSLTALFELLGGNRPRASQLLAEARRDAQAIASSRAHAAVTAVVDFVAAQIDDGGSTPHVISDIADVVRLEVREPQVRAAALVLVALVAAWTRDLGLASRVLDEAERAVRSTSHESLQQATLVLAVSWVGARIGDQSRAARLVTDVSTVMDAWGDDPVTRAVLKSLASALGAWAAESGPSPPAPDAGNTDGVAVMPAPSWVAGVTVVLRWALAMRSREHAAEAWHEARGLVGGLEVASDRGFALAWLGLAEAIRGDRELALGTFDQAAGAAALVDGDSVAQAGLVLVVDWIRAQLGDTARARRLLGDLAELIRVGSTEAIERSVMLALTAWASAADPQPWPEPDVGGGKRQSPGWFEGAASLVHWALGACTTRQQTADLLNESRTNADAVSDPEDRVIALAVLAWVQGCTGSPTEGLVTLDEAERAAESIDDDGPLRAVLRAVVDWIGAHLGDPDRTSRFTTRLIEAVQGVPDPMWRAMALCGVAWATAWSAGQGQKQQTLDGSKAWRSPRWLTGIGTTVRWLIAAAGNRKQAVAILTEVRSVADTLTDPVQQSVALVGAACVAASTGHQTLARRMVDRIRFTTDAVPDPQIRALMLIAAAWLGVWAGDRGLASHVLDEAERAAERMGADDAWAQAIITTVVDWTIAKIGNETRASRLMSNAADRLVTLMDDPASRVVVAALVGWVAAWAHEPRAAEDGPHRNRPDTPVEDWFDPEGHALNWKSVQRVAHQAIADSGAGVTPPTAVVARRGYPGTICRFAQGGQTSDR